MANDQELKYKIGVSVDTSGAVVAEKAIEKVDAAATEAGKGAGEAAAAVGDLASSAKAVGSQGEAAADSLGEIAEGAGEVASQSEKAKEALSKLEAEERALADAKKRSAAAAEASNKASRGGSQALQDLRGAATGATGGLLKVGDAMRSIGLAFKANPIGAVATVIFTALPAIRAGLNKMVDVQEAALQKMRDRDTRTAEKLQSNLEDLATTSGRSMEKIVADAEAASAAYERLSTQIDKTVQRYAALNAAQVELELARIAEEERVALAAVTSEPAREIVRTSFGRRREDLRSRSASMEIENEDLNARNRIAISQQVKMEAEAALRPFLIAAAEARAAAETEVGKSGDAVRTSGGTGFARSSLNAARLAVAQADAAEAELAQIQALQGEIIRRAEEDRQAALDLLAVNAIRRETLGVGRGSVEAQRKAEDAGPAKGPFNQLTGDRLPEAVRPVVDAAKEAAAAIKGARPLDLREAAGGIIQIGDVFVQVQGENQKQFDNFNQALKATSDRFQRELERMNARVENMKGMQQ